jgi:predicted transcriptional regulator
MVKLLKSKMKQRELDWRRSQVLELSSEGYSQREIAARLQLDAAAVNRDIQFLRQQAQDNLQKHIHEVVPEEYQKCMVGMKTILKNTLQIAETVTDPSIKLQANGVAKDCYKFILDMSTNAGIVSDALKYVAQKKEELSTLLNNSDIEEGAKEIQITTNQVF